MLPRIAFLPPSVLKQVRRRERVGRSLLKYPVVEKILREVAARCRRLYDEAQIVRENDAFRPLANRESDKPLGYQDLDHEVAAFLAYRNDIRSGRIERTESGVLFERQERELTELLGWGKVRTVLNFGVCYGYIDNMLAERFPKLQFVGVDRSKFTKAMNDAEFKQPNLIFIAGDGLEVLSALKPDVLMHSRTAVCLNKPAMQKLYRTAAAAGVKYISGYEQYGASWQTFEPYIFDLSDKDSVLYRHFMFIHNYPGLLQAAGYRTERFDIVRTASDKEDLRILSFLGAR